MEGDEGGANGLALGGGQVEDAGAKAAGELVQSGEVDCPAGRGEAVRQGDGCGDLLDGGAGCGQWGHVQPSVTGGRCQEKVSAPFPAKAAERARFVNGFPSRCVKTFEVLAMDPTEIGIFNLAEARLAWVDARQRVLAQNVANANTPGFQPRDVAPFVAMVASAGLRQTSPQHLPGARVGAGDVHGRPQARTPNGNGISLEEQLTQVADTAGMQSLALNLHRRYQAMVRTAFGRAG